MSTTASSVKRLASPGTPGQQSTPPPTPPEAEPQEKATQPRPASPPQEAVQADSFVGWLRRAAPTIVIMLVLGAIGVYGHVTHWKLPKFSAIFGGGDADKKDWCDDHSVSEAECVECNPGLWPKPKAYGWCTTHGVHDCPLENPQVAQVHKQPSSEELQALREQAKRALDFMPRAENNKKCTQHPKRIQVSEKAVQKLGLTPEPVWQAAMEETVTAYGEVGYDPERVVAFASLLSGRILQVQKKIGETVEKGEILAIIESPEVGKAKSELLQAAAQRDLKNKTVERLAPLVAQGAVADAKLREAETEAREAHIRFVAAQQALANLGMPIRLKEIEGLSPDDLARRLKFLGLPDDLVKNLNPDTTTSNLLAVKSNIAGRVIDRKAKVGELADSTKTLYVIADTSHMWLTLSVSQDDRKQVGVGQKVRFSPDGHTELATGKIVWKSPEVDDKTRMLKVRVNLPNPDGHLLANTFGTGTIILREEPNAVVVKNEAIHSDGNCLIVFVQDKDFHKAGAPKLFHVRNIRIAAKNDQYAEVIAGVLPGEFVITQGSEALRTQLLKSSLGAG